MSKNNYLDVGYDISCSVLESRLLLAGDVIPDPFSADDPDDTSSFGHAPLAPQRQVSAGTSDLFLNKSNNLATHTFKIYEWDIANGSVIATLTFSTPNSIAKDMVWSITNIRVFNGSSWSNLTRGIKFIGDTLILEQYVFRYQPNSLIETEINLTYKFLGSDGNYTSTSADSTITYQVIENTTDPYFEYFPSIIVEANTTYTHNLVDFSISDEDINKGDFIESFDIHFIDNGITAMYNNQRIYSLQFSRISEFNKVKFSFTHLSSDQKFIAKYYFNDSGSNQTQDGTITFIAKATGTVQYNVNFVGRTFTPTGGQLTMPFYLTKGSVTGNSNNDTVAYSAVSVQVFDISSGVLIMSIANNSSILANADPADPINSVIYNISTSASLFPNKSIVHILTKATINNLTYYSPFHFYVGQNNQQINYPPRNALLDDEQFYENELLVGTVTAFDPENDVLTYLLLTNNSVFGLDNNTLTLHNYLDYDTVSSHFWNVSIQVSDGKNAITLFSTVTILDVNEAPVLAATSIVTVTEGSVSIGQKISTINASDPEGNQLNYSIMNVVTVDSFGVTNTYDNSNFVFDSSGNLLTSNVSTVPVATVNLPYKKNTKVYVTFRIDDSVSTVTGIQIVDIIASLNKLITGITPTTISVNESVSVGSVLQVLSVQDLDANDTHYFRIISVSAYSNGLSTPAVINSNDFSIINNEVKLLNPLDYETYTKYLITYETTDRAVGTASDTSSYIETLTIDILDELEKPSSADLTITLSEDTIFAWTNVSVLFLISGSHATFNLFYFETLPTKGIITLNGVTVTAGQAIASNLISQLVYTPAKDISGNNIDRFLFHVVDTANVSSSSYNVIIDIEPVNDAPSGIMHSPTLISEDANTGIVVSTLTAIDIDGLADNHTYAIEGILQVNHSGVTTTVASNLFTISGNKIILNGSLNYLLQSSFIINVKATDSGLNNPAFALSVNENIIIQITDANDPITAVSPSVTTVPESTQPGTTLATFSVTDKDTNDTYTFVLEMVNGLRKVGNLWANVSSLQYFTISGNKLILNNFLDFERYELLEIILKVTDGGLGDPNAISTYLHTFTINVTDINEFAPDSSDVVRSIQEDTTYTFNQNHIIFTDADVGDVFTNLIIETLPSNGTLWLNNIRIQASTTISVADIGKLEFRPLSNEYGNSYASIEFSVVDSVGKMSSTYSFTWNVIPVADPISGASISNNTVPENSAIGYEVGTFTFTDPDTLDTYSIIIKDIQKYIRGGITSVNANTQFRVILNSNNELVLTVNGAINYEDTTSFVLDLTVNDYGNGLSSILSSIDIVVTITVTDVNDPITDISPKTVTIPETTSAGQTIITFTVDDEDITDTYKNKILAVNLIDSAGKITDGTNQNIFSTNGIELMVGVGLDYEKFVSAEIIFEISDSGKGDISSISKLNYTVTVILTDVNDEIPTSQDFDIQMMEDTTYTFSSILIAFADADVNDSLNNVIITSLPTNGTLMLNNITVTVGQTIKSFDLPNLHYIPEAKGSGNPYTELIFKVEDQGGNKSNNYTATIYVSAVNDAPTDIVLSQNELLENEVIGTMVGVLITDDPDENDTFTYQILAVVRYDNDGSSTTMSNSDFSISGDVLLANVTADFEKTTRYVLKIKSTDSGLGISANVASIDKLVTVSVIDGNDPITDVNPKIIQIDESPHFGSDILTYVVEDDDVNDSHFFNILKVEGIDKQGTVIDITNQNLFAIQNSKLMVAGELDYEQYENYIIYFEVTDTGLGDVNKISTYTAATTVSLNDINDEKPTSSDLRYGMDEDTTFTFGGTQTIPFMDRDSGDALTGIQITNLPQNGELKLNVVNVSQNQIIAIANLSSLRFIPGKNEFGSNYATLSFVVIDSGGNKSAGNEIVWDVTNINDPPTSISLSPESIYENLANGTTIGILSAIDNDANDKHTFQILSAKVVKRSGVTVPISVTFFKIVGKFLIIDGDANFENDDKFLVRIRVTDLIGSTYDEIKTITILDDNDPITAVKPSILNADEDVPIGTKLSTLQITDEDVNDTYTVSVLSVFGIDSTGASIDVSNVGYISFSGLEMIVSNSLDYESHKRLTIIVEVKDTKKGPASSSVYTHTIVLNVNDKNDNIPDTQDVSLTIPENSTYSFTSSDFPFIDKDTVDQLTSVRFHTVPGKGKLTLGGQVITAGQVVLESDLSLIRYIPEIYEFGGNYASLVFSVIDIGGNESSAKKISWDVTPVNNAPLSVSLDNNRFEENQPPGTTIGTISVDDPDIGDVHTHTIVTIILYNKQGLPQLLPNNAFTINGNVLIANKSFDFEIDSRIEIEIITSDSSESLKSKINLVIEDSNDPITAVTPTLVIVPESLPSGSEIVQLAIQDQDAQDNYNSKILSVVARDKLGAVLTQVILNSPIRMIGTTMVVGSGFDYEKYSQLLVNIEVTDSGFGSGSVISTYTTAVTVIVTDENDEPPTTSHITITVPEDVTHTFSELSFPFSTIEANDVLKGLIIVSIPLNGALTIDGQLVAPGQELSIEEMNKLMFVSSLDEFGSPYSEWVYRIIDSGDNKSTKATATIYVSPVNDAPTDITLTSRTILEEQNNVTVGMLDAIDIDTGDTHSFKIIEVLGINSSGVTTTLLNSSFNITNNNLVLTGKINYEQYQLLQVTIIATDSGLGTPTNQLSVEQTFTLSIIDQNEAIISVSPKNANVDETASLATKIVEITVTDTDQNDSHSIDITSIVSDTGVKVSNSLFNFVGRELQVNSSLDYETHSIFVVGIKVSDSGFGDRSKITTLDTFITITINNKNDENPVSADVTYTVNEDEIFTMGTMTLDFNDKDAGDRIKEYVIETIPVKGQLIFEGSAIVANTTFTPEEWKKIMFIPDANEFGVNYASFTAKVVDQGDNQSNSVTISWEVLSRNDKPTDILVDNEDVEENILANTVVGTLTVVDSDVADSHSLQLLEVESILANGSTYSIGLTAFSLNGNVLHIQTSVDYETTRFYRIKIKATETSTSKLESIEKWITYTVHDNNDPITDILPNLASVKEGEAVNTLITTLTVIDQDIQDTYSFEIVKVLGLDNSGTLSDVTSQNYIEIRNNDLLVGSIIDYSIIQRLEVEIKVKDSTSEYSKTITITVIDVNNHIPTSSDIEVHIDEDSPFAFSTISFAFTDADTNDSLSGIVLQSNVTQGVLMLYNKIISLSQTIAAADISKIIYLPGKDYNGNDTFIFSVVDLGNLVSEKYTFTFIVDPLNDAPSDITSDTNQIIEDQPLGSSFATLSVEDIDDGDSHKLTIENIFALDKDGNTISFANTDFSIVGNVLVQNKLISYEDFRSIIISVKATDTGLGISANILSAVKSLTYTVVNINDPITDVTPNDVTVPESDAKGTNIATLSVEDEDVQETYTYKILKVDGVSGTNTMDITANTPYSIENEIIKLETSLDYEKYTENILVIEVTDSGQGDSSSKSSYIHTLTIHVTDEFDENPTSNDVTFTINEDETFTFGIQNIPFMDQDKGDSISAIVITSLPTDGMLTLNGQAVSIGQIIPISEVPNLQYAPDANLWGKAQGISKFQVLDKNSLASPEYSFVWDVIATNDPITDIEALPLSFPEKTPKNTVISTLSVADIDDTDSHKFKVISVIRYNRDSTTTTLANNAFTVLNGEILVQINNNFRDHISFKITIEATDSGLGDKNNISTFNKEFMFTLIDVNDPITNVSPTKADVAENENLGKAVLTLTVEDEDTGDKYMYSIIGTEAIDASGRTTTISNLPFDLANEELRITQSLDYELYRTYYITVSVSDSGLANPASASSFIQTLTINILPINDEIPESSDLRFSIDEDSTFSFGTYTIPFSDKDANDTLQGLIIAKIPTDGKLTLFGNDIAVGDIINANDISKIVFVPKKNSYGDDNDTIVYRVIDQGNNESELYTVTWNVIAVNDAPTGVDLNPENIDENSPIGTEVGELTAIDVDDNPNQTHSYEVLEATGYNSKNEAVGPTGKLFNANGNKLLTNQSINYEQAEYYIIKLKVSDSGLGEPSQIKSIETEVTVTVNDINEKPVFIDKYSTITAIENSEIYSPENQYLQKLFVDPEGGKVTVEEISSTATWPVLKDGKLYGAPKKVETIEVTVSVTDLEGNKEIGILTIIVKPFIPPPSAPQEPDQEQNYNDYEGNGIKQQNGQEIFGGKNYRDRSLKIIKKILGDYSDLDLYGVFVGKTISGQSSKSGHSSYEIYAGELEKKLGRILNRGLEEGAYIAKRGEGYFYSSFDLVSERLRGIVNSKSDPWLIEFRNINSVIDLGVNGQSASFWFNFALKASQKISKQDEVPDKPFIVKDDLDLLFYEESLEEKLKENREKLLNDLAISGQDNSETIIADIIFRLGQQNINNRTTSYLQKLVSDSKLDNSVSIEKIRQVVRTILKKLLAENKNAEFNSIENNITTLIDNISDQE